MSERRFVFRAAVVVDLRRRRDEEAQRARAAAQDALQRAREALGEARRQLHAACDRRHEPDADPEWYRNWMVGLRAAIARRTAIVAARQREYEEALTRALRARRDLRAIERLRDRRLRAFNRETERREQRQIDALATQRHVRDQVSRLKSEVDLRPET